jgi:hypothetical protein
LLIPGGRNGDLLDAGGADRVLNLLDLEDLDRGLLQAVAGLLDDLLGASLTAAVCWVTSLPPGICWTTGLMPTIC